MSADREQARPVRRVAHTRPLYFHDGKLYCARFDRVYSTTDYGRTFNEEGELSVRIPLRQLIKRFRLAQRVMRAAIYRMRVLPDGTTVYTFRGGVYVRRPGEPTARRTYAVEKGSRPVSLAAGADGTVVFGEYWSNQARDAVRIFGSRDSGASWEVLHTFRPGEIRHVHGISYDRWEDCFWVCTGDEGDENRLLRASKHFSELRIIRQGGQGNRFYSLIVREHDLVTATDTPLEDNFICTIDKRTAELKHVARIENASFYSCTVGDRTFVSTNAEPSAVNDTRTSYVWSGSRDDDWRRVLTFPADLYHRLTELPGVPQGLFQYPRIFFPEGENPGRTLVCHAIGVRGYDGAMLCFDTEAWAR
ncbi:MAG TPA: hypothetical protein VD788_16030 [Candidatus Polarisedimenticolaceae bacterium]|nr:hypothetical protein [Candidatus Polarisedimenticolaceae bacterium]